MIGEFVLEEIDLTLEVSCFFLFLGRNSGVEDDEAATILCLFGGKRDLEEDPEVFFVIPMSGGESFSSTDGTDLSRFSPLNQGGS